LAIDCRRPRTSLRSPAAAAPPGEADIIIIVGRPDRPSSNRRPEPESAKKKSATSPTSRSAAQAAQPDRAGQSAGGASRARNDNKSG
jgi:hypothetical protein